jgi:hypothetical protein
MFPRLNPQVRPSITDTELHFNSRIAAVHATSDAVSECKEVPERQVTDDESYPYLWRWSLRSEPKASSRY